MSDNSATFYFDSNDLSRLLRIYDADQALKRSVKHLIEVRTILLAVSVLCVWHLKKAYWASNELIKTG